MATIFPSTPTVGQVFQGYEWDGTSWNTVGVDLSADYALSSELSSHESDSTNIHGISNTADLATKTYADNAATTAASGIVDAAPSTLNTLNELAAALNDDASFATTVTTSISLKAPIDSPSFTGIPISPTAVDGTNTGQIATTSFVQNSLLNKINSQLNSYTLILSDVNKMITINNSSPTTLSIPLNSSVQFPVGATLTILQSGTGQVSIAGVAGVTINSTPGLKLRTQWSSANLIKLNTDSWVALGDLTA